MSAQKEETRLRLLEAARHLLLLRGFHGVSLEDIAEAAGVSRQAVYKSHFASKADLTLALVRHLHVAEKLDELIEPIHHATSGRAMLEATIVTLVQMESRVHELGLVLSTAALSDTGAAAAWRDRVEVKRGALRAALTRTQGDGHFSPAWKLEEAVNWLAALLSVDSYQQLVVERGWKPEALIRRIWEMCRANLLVLEPERNNVVRLPTRRKR